MLRDGEILAFVRGLEEGGSELQMSGFEFVSMANYGLEDERYAIDFFLFCSHEVIAIMKNMGYIPSMGLGKEVPIETTPQNVLSLIGVEGPSSPLLAFSDEYLPPEEATHARPL